MTKLTEHFTLEELTRTSNAALQAQNRREAEAHMAELRSVALMLELIRSEVGAPLEVHSGFRCPALNGATAGSSKVSQHMLGQAADFSIVGPDSDTSINGLFGQVQEILVEYKVPFGQLIKEVADRGYGKARWLHISLGEPYRKAARCREVFTLVNGKLEGDIRKLEW